ncbi:hypothetical protein ACJ41O_006156 [Fusarium nematophilum]
MRTQIFLLTGALALSAAGLHDRGVTECFSVADEIFSSWSTDYPEVESTVADFIAEQTVTDPCVVPLVTGSLAEEYTSFMSALEDWAADHGDDFSSLTEACSGVTEVSSEIGDMLTRAFCGEFKWASETGSPSSDDDNDGDSSDSSNSESETDNSAPRETGMAMAAAAIAGFVMAGIY